MLLSGHETAAACGLPSISSFHAGSHPTHSVGYETPSSPVPPLTGADGLSSAQTGAALGRALASVCIHFLSVVHGLSLQTVHDMTFSVFAIVIIVIIIAGLFFQAFQTTPNHLIAQIFNFT